VSYNLYQTINDPATLGLPSDGVAVSGTNTYYSSPVSCERSDGFGISIVWTGTPTGTFTVWKSDKKDPNLANDNDWEQDTDFNGGTGSLATGGAAGKYGNSTMNAKNHLWRVKYVNASGTGTIFTYATRPKMS